MGARLAQNAFRANEPILVLVEFENASSVEVRRIKVELKERIHFRAQGHSTTKHNTLASTFLPAVQPSEGFGAWNQTSPMQVQLQVPQVQRCSLRAPLLQVEHCVEVRAETPFGMTNPEIDLPVTLHRSPAVFSMITEMATHPSNEGVPGGDCIPYHPNTAAMHSPGEVQLQPSAPVAPFEADPNQALQTAPVPAQMAMQPGAPGARDFTEGGAVVQPAPMQEPLMTK